ncbi:tetratricopeptide repeat protein [Flavobacterium sp. EDS]|uniref:tetratricopeptide repeat-containing sensor histidine kinase n=1 Tax=Flavobacterium sp. EDS TaxID=2897328 RepID=UPI001E4E68A5|nr:tetratricopeptide repeat-containing sensor histidine kinase [Flavobacterium sp. EDS]MCD0476699.1 tetratricopeptide repeat protein [Flavobacterium sp. EDS]
MKLIKVHFPILILTLVLAISSCEKKTDTVTETENNYTNYIALADQHFNNQTYDSAFYYYNKSRLECKPDENERIIYAYLKMAVTQQIQGDYSGSETSATEAIPFFTKTTNPYYKCAVYNNLGINYERLNEYDDAIYNYNQAIKYAEIGLQKDVLNNNIAVVYIGKTNYEKAINILYPLSQKKDIANDPRNHARILDNLGYSYYKLDNPKAVEYIEQSKLIRQNINDDFGITTSFLHLSELYSNNNIKLAHEYANLAYLKATEANNVNDRLSSLNLLIKNSNGEKLKKTTLLYLKINDSIIKARQKAKNQFAKIKYDSKLDREENLKLKAQKAENALQLEKIKNRNLTLYIIISLVLGSIFFLYYYLTTKGKREKTAAIYESETRISKKLHDELANEVYHTIVLAETKDLSSSENKEILLSNLDTIYSGTRNISRQNSTIDTGENFESELKEMLSSYNGNEVSVIIKDNNDINWPKIQSEKKIAVYRVLQELLVNMKKHSQCSFVVIGFEENDKQVQIQYSDNGIGFSGKMNLRNGLKNAENRIHNIKGTLTFESEPNKGLKVKITFPK